MKTFQCLQCNKIFESKKADKNRQPKFCSIQCASRRFIKWKVCQNCGKQFYNWQNKMFCSMKCSGEYKRGKTFSISHKRKLSEAKIGRTHTTSLEARENISKALTGKSQPWNTDGKHHAWKGDRVGYTGMHQWIRRKLGVPKECEHCGSKNKKKYEWANIDHRYRRNVKDYRRLCTKCHRNYDLGKIIIL